jgi:large subunit ribosomal protein L28
MNQLGRFKLILVMSKICQITGKRPIVGNNVSHSNIKTKRRFNPNLQTKRIYIKEVDKTIKVKLTTRALRNMEKIGTYRYLKQQIAAGFDPKVWVETKASKAAAAKAKRGYRRVETTGKDGNKSFAISYEPNLAPQKKVKLSTIL